MKEEKIKEKINSELSGFLSKVSGIYDSFYCDIPWQRNQVNENMLAMLAPHQPTTTNHDYIENLLQTTLFNEAQKRRRDLIFGQSLSEIKDSFLLFENSQIPELIFQDEEEMIVKDQKEDERVLVKKEESLKFQDRSESEFEVQESQFGLNYESRQEKKIFSRKTKEKALKFAEKFGVKNAAEQLNLPISKIKMWKKNDKNSLAFRGRKPVDPRMEINLVQWLQTEISEENYLTQSLIRRKAKEYSNQSNFKASKGWLEKFFKRNPELFQKYSDNKEKYMNKLFKESYMIRNNKEKGEEENIMKFNDQ